MKCALKEYLKERGITIYRVMKETGMSQKAIYDLVNNHTKGIQFDTLERICKALSCTPNDILKMD